MRGWRRRRRRRRRGEEGGGGTPINTTKRRPEPQKLPFVLAVNNDALKLIDKVAIKHCRDKVGASSWSYNVADEGLHILFNESYVSKIGNRVDTKAGCSFENSCCDNGCFADFARGFEAAARTVSDRFSLEDLCDLNRVQL